MGSGFAKPITIKDAIDNIVDRTYLLPAIQRKFVWSSDKIEVLFDSIMRGYPINSFMFWEVKSDTIKNEFKFYQFLTEYRQFFKENNPDIDTKGYKDFLAVIDGQQRLTSLYIGLKGSYAYKMPRKWLYDTEEAIPTRHLYLNLAAPLPDENDRQMTYDFQFLTKSEYERKAANPGSNWYKINNILTFKDQNQIDDFIDKQGWLSKDFTKQTFRRLFKVIFEEQLVNFYLEKVQEIDTVLDIFIRTNSGGEPLSFSDLLMSITTANWKADARKEIADVVTKVFEIGKPGFLISKDFVLKTCLVLLNDNIKFQVRNFDQTNVITFEKNWDRIKKSMIETFTLLANMGFNNHNLRAKNAAIPIIYYIFHRGLENDINNPIRYIDDKKLIKTWLCLSILKGVFGGQSDNVLTGVRKAIKEDLTSDTWTNKFPYNRIRNEFKSNPAKNLTFDEDFIEGLLETQKDSSDCFVILSLLYSHLNFSNQDYHKDHLHPANYFYSLKKSDFAVEDDFNFYSDPKNWNSILNLQLLNGILNNSKQDKDLDDWVRDNHIDRSSQLIPNCSLDIKDFKMFISERKVLLKKKLRELLS